MIRIIAGKNKGRKIIVPSDYLTTKPTKDMVREAIFSALSFKINDAIILDLFGGSGALSFESLSRGAKKAYINDLDKNAIKVIKENAKNLLETPTITNLDYKNAIENLSVKFDVVFLDPPYALDVYNEVVSRLISKDLLNKDAVFVLESNHKLNLDEFNFTKIKEYKFGKTLVYIAWR